MFAFACCQAENQESVPVEALPSATPAVVEPEAKEEEPVVVEPPPAEPEPPKEEPKEEPKEAEPAKVTFVECMLKREQGAAWGLTFETAGPYLLIFAIKPGGLLDVYNSSVEERAQVRAQDLVASVNGKTAVTEMADELKSTGSVTLGVWRPEQFVHLITRQSIGQPWGIQLNVDQLQKVIHVTGISADGAADSYNKDGAPEAQLWADDLIVGCNDKGGSAKDIVAVMKDSKVESLKLHVVRKPKESQE